MDAYAFQAKLTRIAPLGLTARGLRFDVSLLAASPKGGLPGALLTMPELSVLAAPNFQWPDIDLPLHGAAFWETSDEDLSTANSTMYGFTGSVNVATGVLKVSAHSLAAVNRPAGVG